MVIAGWINLTLVVAPKKLPCVAIEWKVRS